MKNHLPLNNKINCAGLSCGAVMIQPFCLVPTAEELSNPDYAPHPWDCPYPRRLIGVR